MVKWICFTFLLLVSCSNSIQYDPSLPTLDAQQLWDDPQERPIYIEQIRASETAVLIGARQKICIELDEFQIWEEGEYGIDVYSRIYQSISIEVDNQPLANPTADVSSYTIGINRFNENGEVVGMHGGGVVVCFDIRELSTGIHSARITFASGLGTRYLYSWAFEIVETDGTRLVTFPE